MRFPCLACLALAACSGSSFNVADPPPPDAAPDAPAEVAQGDDGGADVVHPDGAELDAAGDGAGDALEAGDGGALEAALDAPVDACAVSHDDGYGETFVNCVPLGTFDKGEATAACARHTGDVTECGYVHGGGNLDAICSNMGAALCACWQYDGADAGMVNHGEQGCQFPGTLGTNTAWN
jgi:hypothetical protein